MAKIKSISLNKTQKHLIRAGQMTKSQLQYFIKQKNSIYQLDDECVKFFEGLVLSDKHESEIFFQYFNKFQHITTSECFSTGLFYLTSINRDYIDFIIEHQYYSMFCVAAFNLRHLSNDKNHIITWDAIFNYYLHQFESALKANSVINFTHSALSSQDPFFNAMRTAIDHFCKDRDIIMPEALMDSFYNKESNHYKKIKHLLKPCDKKAAKS